MGKRMYYVFKIIQESQDKAISGKEILKKLEEYQIFVDIKTIYSCIKNINMFFYEWIHDDVIISVKRTGFMIKNDFFIDGELQFLLDQIVYHEDLNYEDKMILKEKLFQFSSSHQQSRILTSQPSHKQQSFSLILNISTIMKAIDHHSVISFEYINYVVQDNHLIEESSTHGNEGKLYFVSPYQIIPQNNHYYLIGYNTKYHNELSIYRIDRMRYIQTTHQNFIEIREQFDMNEEIQKMMNMFTAQDKKTLQFVCDHSILREVVSRFGQNIEIQNLYQNHYMVTVADVPISDGLIGWILMLQNHIQVVAPLSLKDDLKSRIEAMLQLYHE